MRYLTLEDWLEHIERLHSIPIDMGLERMSELIKRLDIHFECPVITVAGTNGKGSTCAMLEAIYGAAGYKTAMHTSPHLLRFNERARVQAKEVDDESLMRAFELVEKARADMSLSYFEYTALGILKHFQLENPDVVILEIGLGGRLDAINAIDPTVSIISTVGIDHTAYLGDTREKIGWEKAHIFRSLKPAIVSDPDCPQSVIDYAREIKANLLRNKVDFEVTVNKDATFNFEFADESYQNLPRPNLKGVNQYQNVSGVLAAISSLKEKLPVTKEAIGCGLSKVSVEGRFEVVQTTPFEIVLDVGHNPEAAKVLAKNVTDSKKQGERTLAVFGMLHDKDMLSVSSNLKDTIDEWFVATLTGPRRATASELKENMLKAQISESVIHTFDSVSLALESALKKANEELAANRVARVIIFGSFVTVSQAQIELAKILKK